MTGTTNAMSSEIKDGIIKINIEVQGGVAPNISEINGTSITVQYEGGEVTSVFAGEPIQVNVPAYSTCTIKAGQTEWYVSPEDKTVKSLPDTVTETTLTFQECYFKATISCNVTSTYWENATPTVTMKYDDVETVVSPGTYTKCPANKTITLTCSDVDKYLTPSDIEISNRTGTTHSFQWKTQVLNISLETNVPDDINKLYGTSVLVNGETWTINNSATVTSYAAYDETIEIVFPEIEGYKTPDSINYTTNQTTRNISVSYLILTKQETIFKIKNPTGSDVENANNYIIYWKPSSNADWSGSVSMNDSILLDNGVDYTLSIGFLNNTQLLFGTTPDQNITAEGGTLVTLTFNLVSRNLNRTFYVTTDYGQCYIDEYNSYNFDRIGVGYKSSNTKYYLLNDCFFAPLVHFGYFSDYNSISGYNFYLYCVDNNIDSNLYLVGRYGTNLYGSFDSLRTCIGRSVNDYMNDSNITSEYLSSAMARCDFENYISDMFDDSIGVNAYYINDSVSYNSQYANVAYYTFQNSKIYAGDYYVSYIMRNGTSTESYLYVNINTVTTV